MLTQNLGYPRIGSQRELKKASESYWSGKTTLNNLLAVGKTIRQENWKLQKESGIDLIPCNDFSFYDQVLDMSLTVNAIPKRFHQVMFDRNNTELDLCFAMARGYQKNGLDVTAMEMTKWFDTNYHYIVPEFYKDQQFKLFSTKVIDEFQEAKQLGIVAKPVLIGPMSYLLLGKEKESGFDRLDLANNLLLVYIELLKKLQNLNVQWIQFDEPFLAMDLTDKAKETYTYIYKEMAHQFPSIKILLATYFDGLRDNLTLATSLPAQALHIDLARYPQQLDEVLKTLPENITLSLGMVDGRNIWKNDFTRSLALINKAVNVLGASRVMVAPSCSLLHSPCDLDLETNDDTLLPEIKNWMSFAKQKLTEVSVLRGLAQAATSESNADLLHQNRQAIASRKTSARIHRPEVNKRLTSIVSDDEHRKSDFAVRQKKQQQALSLPLFPTTSIGSFPQTEEVRSWRARWKKGDISEVEYNRLIEAETAKAVKWQEEIGIDVLVHGEFERNDMVEYFGEQLDGYVFSKNGWVQSYSSRCVKPPIIYGDVSRPKPMTVHATTFAQSLTSKPMKGMLTGPVTILQWSFVRDDQPRKDTCIQIALAIRDEYGILKTPASTSSR